MDRFVRLTLTWISPLLHFPQLHTRNGNIFHPPTSVYHVHGREAFVVLPSKKLGLFQNQLLHEKMCLDILIKASVKQPLFFTLAYIFKDTQGMFDCVHFAHQAQTCLIAITVYTGKVSTTQHCSPAPKYFSTSLAEVELGSCQCVTVNVPFIPHFVEYYTLL